MRWPEDAADWPHSDRSRIVDCAPHRWHVQEMGAGDLILLLHGAGGATHSFRDLAPRLARSHRVVAIDLPGQGFTRAGRRDRFGLEPMAEDLAKLAGREGWTPSRVVAHSAGAAIALRLAELGLPGEIVGLNAALSRFDGIAGWLFPLMARVLSVAPLTARLFSATATESSVRRLIEGTGSRIGAEGVALYSRLAQDRDHVDATLNMMAQWEIDPLLARLGGIDRPVRLLAGTGDRAVPPRASREAAEALPGGRFEEVPGLGHLMHEEDPAGLADRILEET